MEEFYLYKPYEHVLLKEGLKREFGGKSFVSDRIYDRIAKRVGEEPVTILGYGDKGVAYGLPSGKVLKVTSDEGELRAMNLLRGRRHANLVQVFDVFVVPVPGSEEAREGGDGVKKGVGVIVREAVDNTLSDMDAFRALDRLLRMAMVLASDHYSGRSGKVGPRQALWEAMMQFKQELEQDEDLSSVEKIIIFGIEAGIDALMDLGIYVLDLKGTNVGVILGRPVLFDLSMASVPKDSPGLELGKPKRGAHP